MNSITSSTRRAAFDAVPHNDAVTVHRLILASERPLGASEIAAILSWPITSVRPRLCGLRDLGLIEVAAKRSKKNGLSEATWRAVQSFDGKQALIPGMTS